MPYFITVAEAAKKREILQGRVQVLCAAKRIKGVFRLGENWAIPTNTTKPIDSRYKTKENKNE